MKARQIVQAVVLGSAVFSTACSHHDGGNMDAPVLPAPDVDFSATPTAGHAPLEVTFTNLTESDLVTEWFWDFGDGQTSNELHPVHAYDSPGPYDVELIAVGPGGFDVLTKQHFVAVAMPVEDPSFEAQTAGSPPSAPWTITAGTGHVIAPADTSEDNGMPTLGAQWCEVAADDTSASDPGDSTTPPTGGAGIMQVIRYPVGKSLLKFEAAFVRREIRDPNVFRDWMSIDIRDDQGTTRKLFSADTLTPTSTTSAKYPGAAMTPVQTVRVDLKTLFPRSTEATDFVLTVQVGNGGDGQFPSKGYVDSFRFESPKAPFLAQFTSTPPNGTPPHTVTFTDTSGGSGRTWIFGDPGSGAQNTSTSSPAGHVYTSENQYTVTLEATSGENLDIKAAYHYVTVSQAPVASFCIHVSTPCGSGPCLDAVDVPIGTVVTFCNTSMHADHYSWHFGNGQPDSMLENPPAQMYAGPGVFQVTLTAFNQIDTMSTHTGTVHTHAAPSVDFTVVSDPAPQLPQPDPNHLSTNNTLRFLGTNSGGQVDQWQWNFGDSHTDTGQMPLHPYAVTDSESNGYGFFTVSLTAMGPGGSSGPVSRPIYLYPDFHLLVQDAFSFNSTLNMSTCLSCHGGSGGLTLSIWSDLVNHRAGSMGCSPATAIDRVEPGSPDLSYLIRKLENGPSIVCGHMPPPPAPALEMPMSRRTLIRDWIQGGAYKD